MDFSPLWIVLFSVLIVCSLAIIFLAKFATKPVDSYRFSFKRVFPFEVINRDQNSLVYRILLCIFVAASFAPIFIHLTGGGLIENAQGISIAICCVYGFAAISFAFLHYFDATHTVVHLVLVVLFLCLTLLGNALACIKGINVYYTLAQHDQQAYSSLVGGIICGLASLFGIILALNPSLKNWANLSKIDGGFERPRFFILAFTEWASFFLLIIGEIANFLILLIQ